MGCSQPPTSGDAEAGLDASESGAGDAIDNLDAHPSDTPDVSADQGADVRPDVMDVPVDVPPVTCHADSDCMGTPSTPLCDLAMHLCVACLPTADRCPLGSYCSSTDHCVPGCRTAADCGATDAGFACDTATHTCLGCLMDSDCPLGTLCSSRMCIPGCTATHGCPTGSSCCSGMCIDTSSDVMRCGSCTGACGTTNASPACVMSVCQENCTTGWGDCDGNPANGCETATTTSANCGACGVHCTLAHATGTCSSGACAIVSCTTGYTDCDMDPSTGCEANLQTDTTNCGTCGTHCVTGQLCNAGTCQCPTGQQVCMGACINTSTDVFNCGGCNVACPAGDMCLSGVCSGDILTYTTSTPPASVAFVDICSMTGATHQLPNTLDGMGAAVTIPFMFRFFDAIYTQVASSADGYLGFGATGTLWGLNGVYTLPSTSAPRPALFVYARNLQQRATGICYITLGTAPTRQFVWEENDAEHYLDTTSHLTWEVFLNEGTNTIDVVYQTLTGTGTTGDTAVVGMQNSTATRSFTYEHTTAGTLMAGLRLRFNPSP